MAPESCPASPLGTGRPRSGPIRAHRGAKEPGGLCTGSCLEQFLSEARVLGSSLWWAWCVGMFFFFSSWDRVEPLQNSVSPSWVLPWLWQADTLTIFLHKKKNLRKIKSLSANSENPRSLSLPVQCSSLSLCTEPLALHGQKEAEQKKMRVYPQYVKQNSSS